MVATADTRTVAGDAGDGDDGGDCGGGGGGGGEAEVHARASTHACVCVAHARVCVWRGSVPPLTEVIFR